MMAIHMALRILAIVAMDEGRVIGKNGTIPWRLPEDMKRFAALTTGHTVLMGRKTYESLPPRFRPLPDRKNVVVTRDPSRLRMEKRIQVVRSPQDYVERCLKGEEQLPSEQLWIIGGEAIYRETLPYWNELYLTLVHSKNDGDTFFPQIEEKFALMNEEKREGFSFLHYVHS